MLLAETGPECCGPRLIECLDLVRGGLSMRARARVPRSDRAGFATVRLMYLVAVAQCAVVVMVVATTAAVRASILAADPDYTAAQWHAELAGSLDPLVMLAVLSVIVLVWVAWCGGRGRRWARAPFIVNFVVTTYSLLHGLAVGSATNARADLAVGIALWLTELATVVVIAVSEAQRVAASRSGARAPVRDPATAFTAADRVRKDGES